MVLKKLYFTGKKINPPSPLPSSSLYATLCESYADSNSTYIELHNDVGLNTKLYQYYLDHPDYPRLALLITGVYENEESFLCRCYEALFNNAAYDIINDIINDIIDNSNEQLIIFLAAINNNMLDIIETMISVGFNISALVIDWVPKLDILNYAINERQLDVIKLLVNNGAVYNIYNGGYCLTSSTMEIFDYIMDNFGSNFDETSFEILFDGLVSIRSNGFNTNEEFIIKYNKLIQLGLSIDTVNRTFNDNVARNQSPCSLSINKLKYLIDNGLILKDNTLLNNSINFNNAVMAKYLMDIGFKPSTEAIKTIFINKNTDLMKVLIDHDFDFSILQTNNENIDIINQMLNNGADPIVLLSYSLTRPRLFTDLTFEFA